MHPESAAQHLILHGRALTMLMGCLCAPGGLLPGAAAADVPVAGRPVPAAIPAASAASRPVVSGHSLRPAGRGGMGEASMLPCAKAGPAGCFSGSLTDPFSIRKH